MARYNAAQSEVAARHGARFLDLDPLIPKDLDHYFDDCHYTDRGSRRMADEIFPTLREGVLERMAGRLPRADAELSRADRGFMAR